MEVFPISDCGSSGERMFHLIFVSEMARMSAIRDMVFMSNGEGGSLESDMEELKQLKMLVRGNGSEDSSSFAMLTSLGMTQNDSTITSLGMTETDGMITSTGMSEDSGMGDFLGMTETDDTLTLLEMTEECEMTGGDGEEANMDVGRDQ